MGLINTHTSPSVIAGHAIEDARYMCTRQYGDAPEVEIKGRTNLTFSYIPSHLYYMLFEVRAPLLAGTPLPGGAPTWSRLARASRR